MSWLEWIMVLGAAGIFSIGLDAYNDDGISEIGQKLIPWLFFIIFVCMSLVSGQKHSDGYKSGQLDCIKGEVKYEMQTGMDTTRTKKSDD